MKKDMQMFKKLSKEQKMQIMKATMSDMLAKGQITQKEYNDFFA